MPLAIVCATFLASTARAAYDDPPRDIIPSSTSLAHVRAQYRAAHVADRTKSVMLIEDWRLQQDGLTGTFRVNRWGNDYRETTTLGPLVYENGMRSGVRWQQNRNGITFTFSGIHERDLVSEHSWDSNDERDVHLIGESVPLNAFVVEIDPTNGRHEWLFIDKKSGQIVRRDRLEHNRRTITTYDEFRPVEGASLPTHIRTVDSLGNERDQTLVSRSIDSTPDPSDVAIVPTRRSLVEFPSGVSSVRLPVRVVNGLLVVRITLDGRPFDFLLDSGAAGIAMDPTVAEALGLERYGEHIGSTTASFVETTAIVPTIGIGLLRMRNIVTRVVPIPFRPDDRTRVAGLIGFDFFAEIIVRIDAEHGIVDVFHPAAFRVPQEYTPVAIGLDDKQPAVRIKIGPVAARVILDTGANRSILGAEFAQRLTPTGQRARPGSSEFNSVGGTASAELVRLNDLEFAGVSTPDPFVDISSADLGFEDVDGLLGTDVLRDYEIYFDYRANMVYARHVAHPLESPQ